MKPIHHAISFHLLMAALSFALATLFLLGGPAQAMATDPFSLENEAKPPRPDANRDKDKQGANDKPGPGPRKRLIPLSEQIADRIRFTAQVKPAAAQPGEVITLTITGKPLKGNHTYPLTQRTHQQNVSQLSKIIYDKSAVFQPLWPVTESKSAFVQQPDGVVWLEHEHEFTWSEEIYIRPSAKPGIHPLRFTIRLMVCDAKGCLPQGPYPPFKVNVEVRGKAVPVTPELEKRLQEKPPEVAVLGPKADDSLWGFILVSMSAAVLMLLTPCVFPMIPITVSFFLKQSEKEHHNALLSAGIYSITIIVVLAGAVLVLGGLIVTLANDPWLNLGLGAVLVFFALSLFGMYEIELPAGLARFTSAREGQGGMIGAFFMALTFTITSFTCTGPFLGPLLVTVKESQLPIDRLILGALAYSATFAAPFFVLALFPRLLKTLPKSGGWLNAIKVVMGFLELAAALKFIANTDLALNPGDPILFTYETVLCAWIALSLGCGLYLLGVFRLPHDSPVEHIGVVRMLFATIFFGLTVYMVPALWRVTPQGVVGRALVAFLPLDTKPDMDWYRNFEEAWEDATKDDQNIKPIFIDFTGVNCTNCRYNEKNVFTKPEVRDFMKNYVRVQLYTDIVPVAGLSAAEASAQGRRNSELQGETFGDITNPFYAIIRPEKGQEPLVKDAEGKWRINGTLVGTRKGLIPANRIKDFERFLKDSR